jgi:hypothetical protein
MLQALYLANANCGGMIIMLTGKIFLYGGILFIRRKWPGQKTS